MNNARLKRRAARWARYFNHYSHTVPNVGVGGRAAAQIVWDGLAGYRYARTFRHIRRQA
jgi:hypothetical protein